MFTRLLECLLIATVLLAMVVLALRESSGAGLKGTLSSPWRRLKESNWRIKVILSALLVFFLSWNAVQVTTTRQYNYPFQKEHYPFTRFAMFTSSYPGPIVSFGRFIGYNRAGKRYEINPDRLFPALSHTGLYTRTDRLAAMLQSSDQQHRIASNELHLWDGVFKRAFLQQEGIELTKVDFAQVRHSTRLGEGAKMAEEIVLWSSDSRSP